MKSAGWMLALPHHIIVGILTRGVLWQDVDFRRDVPSLDMPVYMIIGRHEARGRAVLADEWFAMLAAPSKERVVFEQSGHRPSFKEPPAFIAVMRRIVESTFVGG